MQFHIMQFQFWKGKQVERYLSYQDQSSTLSDGEDNNSGSLNRGGIIGLIFFENIIGSSPEIRRVKFLGNNRLLYIISIFKFGSFKNPFTTITILSELYFRFKIFILQVQTKKVISISYGSTFDKVLPYIRQRTASFCALLYINQSMYHS